MVKVQELHFYGPDDVAHVVVEGYPDQAISLARSLLGEIFSTYGAWHMTAIDAVPPEALEKQLDSEWHVSVSAALKAK